MLDREAIMSNENLSVIGNLEEKIPALAEVMWKDTAKARAGAGARLYRDLCEEYVKAGRHIITEGDVQAAGKERRELRAAQLGFRCGSNRRQQTSHSINRPGCCRAFRV